ncbi:MAG: hypothetical protein ACTS84_04245, partial [Arsenophonus sp. NC-LC2-MAG3]
MKKNKGNKINCLSFADDIALVAETCDESKEQAHELQKQAAKISLRISFEKTKIMTNIKNPPKNFAVGEQKIGSPTTPFPCTSVRLPSLLVIN